jgi:predicted phosphodiesterase
MILKQRDEESFLDWKYRLIEAKLNKEIDVEWADIVEELDLGIHYDTLRKGSAFFFEMKEYFEKQAEGSTIDTELDKLTTKKFELQKERNKLAAEKNEINKWIREQARAENIQDKIELAIANLQPVVVPQIKIESKNNIRTAVVDIADSHFGREGKIEGFHGETIAEYSVDIFKIRMWALLERTIEILKKEDIDSITVLNLGDSTDGLLRFSQLKFLQLGIADQVMQFGEFMSEWLNKLSEYAKVDYYSILANHTEIRPLNSQRGDFPEENVERLITWFIKERLKDNVNVNIHDIQETLYLDVLGTKILCVHGHNEKNLENSIKDYMMIYQVPIHILKTGHLHHHNSKTIGMAGMQNIEYVQSPSICGIDEYSVKLKKTANAGSLITIFEAEYGKSHTYDIRLK